MRTSATRRALASAPVSVIVPLYNGASYIADAIASVVGQQTSPHEVVVIDDGSSDGGPERVASIDAPFPIRVVRQANAGQSAARNHGARLASQPFLAFLDQDDVWCSNHLRLLYGAARSSPRVGWTYGDFDEIDGTGQVVTKRFLRQRGVSHPKISLVDCIAADLMVLPSASLIRAEALTDVGGFDERLRGYEDDDLFIRMFRTGWDQRYVDDSVTRFRIHTGSSSDDGRFVASRLVFGRKLKETVEDDERFQRFYYRDIIAPRLFQACLDDYVRHASAERWDQALEARDAMNEFARERSDFGRKRWKLALIQDPRRLRRGLAVQSRLPRFIRPTSNPAMRLR